jgi:hypothetical protein
VVKGTAGSPSGRRRRGSSRPVMIHTRLAGAP